MVCWCALLYSLLLVTSVQAVFNVINERYPMSDEELMELAGIQAAVNLYGKGVPEDYNGGFFR